MSELLIRYDLVSRRRRLRGAAADRCRGGGGADLEN